MSYWIKIKESIEKMKQVERSNPEYYKLCKVSKFTYIDKNFLNDNVKVHKALQVWLEYYDLDKKKYRYRNSILIDDRFLPWIVDNVDGNISAKADNYRS